MWNKSKCSNKPSYGHQCEKLTIVSLLSPECSVWSVSGEIANKYLIGLTLICFTFHYWEVVLLCYSWAWLLFMLLLGLFRWNICGFFFFFVIEIFTASGFVVCDCKRLQCEVSLVINSQRSPLSHWGHFKFNSRSLNLNVSQDCRIISDNDWHYAAHLFFQFPLGLSLMF